MDDHNYKFITTMINSKLDMMNDMIKQSISYNNTMIINQLNVFISSHLYPYIINVTRSNINIGTINDLITHNNNIIKAHTGELIKKITTHLLQKNQTQINELKQNIPHQDDVIFILQQLNNTSQNIIQHDDDIFTLQQQFNEYHNLASQRDIIHNNDNLASQNDIAMCQQEITHLTNSLTLHISQINDQIELLKNIPTIPIRTTQQITSDIINLKNEINMLTNDYQHINAKLDDLILNHYQKNDMILLKSHNDELYEIIKIIDVKNVSMNQQINELIDKMITIQNDDQYHKLKYDIDMIKQNNDTLQTIIKNVDDKFALINEHINNKFTSLSTIMNEQISTVVDKVYKTENMTSMVGEINVLKSNNESLHDLIHIMNDKFLSIIKSINVLTDNTNKMDNQIKILINNSKNIIGDTSPINDISQHIKSRAIMNVPQNHTIDDTSQHIKSHTIVNVPQNNIINDTSHDNLSQKHSINDTSHTNVTLSQKHSNNNTPHTNDNLSQKHSINNTLRTNVNLPQKHAASLITNNISRNDIIKKVNSHIINNIPRMIVNDSRKHIIIHNDNESTDNCMIELPITKMRDSSKHRTKKQIIHTMHPKKSSVIRLIDKRCAENGYISIRRPNVINLNLNNAITLFKLSSNLRVK